MKFTSSYSIYNESASPQKELERLSVQSTLSWSKEAELMTIYGVNSDSYLVEIGSGPGYVSKEILNSWPSLRLTAIEIDPEMITLSKRHLTDNRLNYICASATQLPLPNDSVDFVLFRFTLQHISNLNLALEEAYRILKPSGKIIITELDPELWGRVYPVEHGLENIYRKHGEEQAKNGGDKLVTRKLIQLLRDTNFKSIRSDMYSYDSEELGLDLFLPQISPERYEPLLDKGIIDPMEYAKVLSAYYRFIEDPNAYVMLLGLMLCAQKKQICHDE